ncbi:ATPase [Marinicrinis lubricantis]|uniref:ATPase n=1 Tax=Marinicrinis lubricantis TaxID=2086470 RepID=A0ABW1IJE8_9BACL
MFKLRQKVYIMKDSFEQGMPVGEYGYIIAIEKNADNAFDYIIRVPKINKHFGVPASDIESEEMLLEQAAEQVQREALIDFALATKNEELFKRIMNGDLDSEPKVEEHQKPLSREEFIKQVNLRAWI